MSLSINVVYLSAKTMVNTMLVVLVTKFLQPCSNIIVFLHVTRCGCAKSTAHRRTETMYMGDEINDLKYVLQKPRCQNTVCGDSNRVTLIGRHWCSSQNWQIAVPTISNTYMQKVFVETTTIDDETHDSLSGTVHRCTNAPSDHKTQSDHSTSWAIYPTYWDQGFYHQVSCLPYLTDSRSCSAFNSETGVSISDISTSHQRCIEYVSCCGSGSCVLQKLCGADVVLLRTGDVLWFRCCAVRVLCG